MYYLFSSIGPPLVARAAVGDLVASDIKVKYRSLSWIAFAWIQSLEGVA